MNITWLTSDMSNDAYFASPTRKKEQDTIYSEKETYWTRKLWGTTNGTLKNMIVFTKGLNAYRNQSDEWLNNLYFSVIVFFDTDK